jgi:membrane-bound metal-dependent hydrolase YbcI (DUF457 family)
MGRGHALMGGTVWLAGCAAVTVADPGGPGLALALIGTPVCAGWALVPDIDHPNSTIAHSAGPISQGVATVVAGMSRLIHEWTRTPADRPDEDGHRTVTHTVLGALIFGAVVGLAGWLGGRWTAAFLVFWPAHLGISTVLRSRRRHQYWGGFRIRKSVVDALILAAVAAALTPGSAWWLGVAAGGGALIHVAGDMLTDGAVPALWPLILRDERGAARRWKPIGVPRGWRFPAGGRFELAFVHPVLWAASTAVLVLDGWLLLAPILTAGGADR